MAILKISFVNKNRVSLKLLSELIIKRKNSFRNPERCPDSALSSQIYYTTICIVFNPAKVYIFRKKLNFSVKTLWCLFKRIR